MAALRARESGARRRRCGEHVGEAVLAEAMAALEQERRVRVVVVLSLAYRAARDSHFRLRFLSHYEFGILRDKID